MLNTSLRRTLSRQEMLELWRLVRHFEPLDEEGVVSRADGIDVDRLLLEDIDRWIAKQYATLEPWQLPVDDISGNLEMETDSDGIGIVSLPAYCRRVTEVWMRGWQRPALITDPDSPLAADQQSPFLRGGCVKPVAVVDGSEMRLYLPPAGASKVDRVMAVVYPTDADTYIVTPFMLPEAFE